MTNIRYAKSLHSSADSRHVIILHSDESSNVSYVATTRYLLYNSKMILNVFNYRCLSLQVAEDNVLSPINPRWFSIRNGFSIGTKDTIDLLSDTPRTFIVQLTLSHVKHSTTRRVSTSSSDVFPTTKRRLSTSSSDVFSTSSSDDFSSTAR